MEFQLMEYKMKNEKTFNSILFYFCFNPMPVHPPPPITPEGWVGGVSYGHIKPLPRKGQCPPILPFNSSPFYFCCSSIPVQGDPVGVSSCLTPHRPVRGGASHRPVRGDASHSTAVGSGMPHFTAVGSEVPPHLIPFHSVFVSILFQVLFYCILFYSIFVSILFQVPFYSFYSLILFRSIEFCYILFWQNDNPLRCGRGRVVWA